MFVGLSKSTSRPLPPSRNRTSSSLGGGTLSTENSTAISTSETARPSKKASSDDRECVSVAIRLRVSLALRSDAFTATRFGSQSSGENTSCRGKT